MSGVTPAQEQDAPQAWEQDGRDIVLRVPVSRLGGCSPAISRARFARRATLSRSVRLLAQFRFEQSEPARFYGALAADTVAMTTDLWTAATGESAAGRTVLDVGGGPGYFASAFEQAGMRYIGVEPDPREAHAGAAEAATSGATSGVGAAADAAEGTFVRASGMALPFADDSVDVCLSSNVAEHVPHPWRLGNEMLRVTKPGGLAVLSLHGVARPVRRARDGVDALSGRGPGRRAVHPQARSPTQERLRLVVVRGVGGRRLCSGAAQHRRADRRFSALPPTMGLVDDRRFQGCVSSW